MSRNRRDPVADQDPVPSDPVREREQAEAFLRSPVGQSIAAKQRGHRFLEVQVEIGSLVAGAAIGLRVPADRPDVLGQIEDEGWRLEHAGYVYLDTSPTGAGRLFAGSEQVTRGAIVGVYLFRNTDR